MESVTVNSPLDRAVLACKRPKVQAQNLRKPNRECTIRQIWCRRIHCTTKMFSYRQWASSWVVPGTVEPTAARHLCLLKGTVLRKCLRTFRQCPFRRSRITLICQPECSSALRQSVAAAQLRRYGLIRAPQRSWTNRYRMGKLEGISH
uniref:(northern house mosquito) hypothetical protein n=1 Tax=Culex pipiens TaxID=7175 RepID=A0A8D8FNQ6_CULPI